MGIGSFNPEHAQMWVDAGEGAEARAHRLSRRTRARRSFGKKRGHRRSSGRAFVRTTGPPTPMKPLAARRSQQRGPRDQGVPRSHQLTERAWIPAARPAWVSGTRGRCSRTIMS
jgi:hypothetical protein